jgi:HSP20 family protein
MFEPLSLLSSRLNWLRNGMDEFFQEVLPDGATSAAYPALNVWEDESAFTLEAEVPGLKAENLELEVLGSEVTLRGERTFETQEGWTCHRQERPQGKFVRTIKLGAPINADKVQAALKHGVLTVTLPKAESIKPRKIEVHRLEKK